MCSNRIVDILKHISFESNPSYTPHGRGKHQRHCWQLCYGQPRRLQMLQCSRPYQLPELEFAIVFLQSAYDF